MNAVVRVMVPLALLAFVAAFAFDKLRGEGDEQPLEEAPNTEENARRSLDVESLREPPPAVAAPPPVEPSMPGPGPIRAAAGAGERGPETEATGRPPSMRLALQRLDRKIREQPFSTRVTRQQRSWAYERLEAHGVEPVDLELGCSPRMCRAAFTFETVRHARDLALIRLPSDFSVIYGTPQALPNGQVELMLFWGVGDTRLGDVLSEP